MSLEEKAKQTLESIFKIHNQAGSVLIPLIVQIRAIQSELLATANPAIVLTQSELSEYNQLIELFINTSLKAQSDILTQTTNVITQVLAFQQGLSPSDN